MHARTAPRVSVETSTPPIAGVALGRDVHRATPGSRVGRTSNGRRRARRPARGRPSSVAHADGDPAGRPGRASSRPSWSSVTPVAVTKIALRLGDVVGERGAVDRSSAQPTSSRSAPRLCVSSSSRAERDRVAGLRMVVRREPAVLRARARPSPSPPRSSRPCTAGRRRSRAGTPRRRTRSGAAPARARRPGAAARPGSGSRTRPSARPAAPARPGRRAGRG